MTEIKNVDEIGLQFLAKEEGLVRRPYLDQRGIPTIGIGMTYYPDTGKKVTMKDEPLTIEKCLSLYKIMLKNYELSVYSVTRDDINQNQFNAQVSLSYNIGVNAYKGSTLVKIVNSNPSDPSIRIAFEAWKNADGKPILLWRRRREAELYFTPVKQIEKSADQLYIEHIKYIQDKLGIKADGIFGKNTKAAVILFQKKNKIVADGIVGEQTLALLNKV